MTTELDLTNAHLPDLSGTEIPPSLTVRPLRYSRRWRNKLMQIFAVVPQAVDLTANRLRTIDPRILGLQGQVLGTRGLVAKALY